MFEQTPLYVLHLDAKGWIRHLNGSLARILSTQPSVARGRHIVELLGHAGWDRLRDAQDRLVQTGRPQAFEWCVTAEGSLAGPPRRLHFTQTTADDGHILLIGMDAPPNTAAPAIRPAPSEVIALSASGDTARPWR